MIILWLSFDFFVCFKTFFVQNGNIDTNLIDSGIQLNPNFEKNVLM